MIGQSRDPALQRRSFAVAVGQTFGPGRGGVRVLGRPLRSDVLKDVFAVRIRFDFERAGRGCGGVIVGPLVENVFVEILLVKSGGQTLHQIQSAARVFLGKRSLKILREAECRNLAAQPGG
jgi:hypothetical protein